MFSKKSILAGAMIVSMVPMFGLVSVVGASDGSDNSGPGGGGDGDRRVEFRADNDGNDFRIERRVRIDENGDRVEQRIRVERDLGLFAVDPFVGVNVGNLNTLSDLGLFHAGVRNPNLILGLGANDAQVTRFHRELHRMIERLLAIDQQLHARFNITAAFPLF